MRCGAETRDISQNVIFFYLDNFSLVLCSDNLLLIKMEISCLKGNNFVLD